MMNATMLVIMIINNSNKCVNERDISDKNKDENNTDKKNSNNNANDSNSNTENHVNNTDNSNKDNNSNVSEDTTPRPTFTAKTIITTITTIAMKLIHAIKIIQALQNSGNDYILPRCPVNRLPIYLLEYKTSTWGLLQMVRKVRWSACNNVKGTIDSTYLVRNNLLS